MILSCSDAQYPGLRTASWTPSWGTSAVRQVRAVRAAAFDYEYLRGRRLQLTCKNRRDGAARCRQGACTLSFEAIAQGRPAPTISHIGCQGGAQHDVETDRMRAARRSHHLHRRAPRPGPQHERRRSGGARLRASSSFNLAAAVWFMSRPLECSLA